MTPDPNTSAKVSRYKRQPHHDTNWWCIDYFLPRGRHTFANVCDRNGRCIAILFNKGIGVRGWLDSPDFTHFWTNFRRLTETHLKPTLSGEIRCSPRKKGP